MYTALLITDKIMINWHNFSGIGKAKLFVLLYLLLLSLTFQEVSENFKRSLHFVLSNFKFHRYLDVNSHVTEKTLRG